MFKFNHSLLKLWSKNSFVRRVDCISKYIMDADNQLQETNKTQKLDVKVVDKRIKCSDPSEHYRPDFEKSKDKFRVYEYNENDLKQNRVLETYKQIHTNQTVVFVKKSRDYWTKFDKVELGVMDALEKLNALVDESDPDVDVPNIVHAFQTAEGIREAHPDDDWFHLTGLIHDLGKIMCLYGESQWAVVGDTFPVGCAYADTIVLRDETFNDNPDLNNARYNTKLGIYEEKCGLDNVLMSWGHDEYMYQVLKNHSKCVLPEKALYAIRYHSFYPWHTKGDYRYLSNEKDESMLPFIREFNNFDLYTKTGEKPDVEKLKPYYQSLIEKYIPGLIKW